MFCRALRKVSLTRCQRLGLYRVCLKGVAGVWISLKGEALKRSVSFSVMWDLTGPLKHSRSERLQLSHTLEFWKCYTANSQALLLWF